MFAVIVNFELDTGVVEQFLPLMLENAETSLRDEAGCHRFDVCTDPCRPSEVFLYELYSDAAAFDVHLNSAHFADFNTATSDMIANKKMHTYRKVYP